MHPETTDSHDYEFQNSIDGIFGQTNIRKFWRTIHSLKGKQLYIPALQKAFEDTSSLDFYEIHEKIGTLHDPSIWEEGTPLNQLLRFYLP